MHEPARDRERVHELLGREPLGAFEVVVRADDGDPVVVRNAPLLDDGTPMPTRYWLVGPDETRAVSRLEAAGGVRRAEREVDPASITDAHRRYAAERDAALPPGHDGPAPTGGVGGTREGVKCLHAHYAWHLAGGDDPVGRWVAGRLALAEAPTIVIGDRSVTVARAPRSAPRWSVELPIGTDLVVDQVLGTDPPAPEDLTNALGIVEDHIADVALAHPDLAGARHVTFAGPHAVTIARVELGLTEVPDELELTRDAAEDVFRTVVTEPGPVRAHNPGLPPTHVRTVVGASLIVVGVMRRLQLASVVVASCGAPEGGNG